ncbi:hypothetical protein [Sporosarcina sp. FSL K6-3457]|uniref:hypothetical protein n=1 Tax=Sporosarcina sp. FSL K6-3457 TaxID=2978204 RepID=UPI0030FA98B4
MAVVILAELEKLDFRLAVKNVSVLESVEQLTGADNGETTFVLAATAENLHALKNEPHHVFVPSMMVTGEGEHSNANIYFELENYSFYQQAKEIIRQEENAKGVFRFRRTVTSAEDKLLFVEDLYVLAGLLGEPEDVYVKMTDQSVTPAYIILMMNFGGGKMAHIEYTVQQQERIELEWSGIKTIVEFDSDEIKPAQPGGKTTLPLAFTVDSILATGHQVNQNILGRLTHFEKLISGGTGK